jgi:DNA polymerase-3 subunit epsilon
MLFSWYKKWKKNRNFSKLKDGSFAYLFEEDCSGEYIAFDTETTGLNPKVDEILSIGAVKIKENKILTSQTFEVYVKNSKAISSKSIEIHKIRPCDLQNAKKSEEAIQEFLAFIGSRPLVGYYLEFDVSMINKYLQPMLGITLPNKMIEVSEIYFDKTITLIPQGNIDLRFDTILKNCAVPNMGAHNAVNDAIMTAMIYLKLTMEKTNVRSTKKTNF